jgi:nucleoside-diphosphate-sugar epimerase
VTAADRAAGSATIVVSGAAGWLGQNLVRALVKQPDRQRIRCLVTNTNDAATLAVLDPRVQTVVGDIRAPAVVDELFGDVGPCSVVHAAAVIHPRKAVREFFDVNVGGTQHMLDRARRVGAMRFVHISSNSPFGANEREDERFTEESRFAPYMAYGKSKLEAEELVSRSQGRGDVETVILRPPWFYGPFQPERQTRFFATVRRGRFPIVGPGTQRRSMVFTGSLVQAVLRAETNANAPGRAYWIADAEPYPLKAIMQTVRDALAAEGLRTSRHQRLRVPRAMSLLAARADGVLQVSGRYVSAIHVLGELKDTIACDISRARAELGYTPDVSLYEGMRASVRWCLDRGLQI